MITVENVASHFCHLVSTVSRWAFKRHKRQGQGEHAHCILSAKQKVIHIWYIKCQECVYLMTDNGILLQLLTKHTYSLTHSQSSENKTRCKEHNTHPGTSMQVTFSINRQRKWKLHMFMCKEFVLEIIQGVIAIEVAICTASMRIPSKQSEIAHISPVCATSFHSLKWNSEWIINTNGM